MRRRRSGLFIAGVLIVTAILLTLGVWQWQRRSEKARFLAAISAAAASEPTSLANAVLWDRVRLTGRFLPDRIAYIRTSRPAPKPGERDGRGQVPVSGFGVWVMQAFELAAAPPGGNGTVLVSRGFLPTPPNGSIPAFATPAGPVTLTGFLRPSEKAGLFPPQNDPARGVFFFRTSEEIAAFLALEGAGRSGVSQPAFATFIDRESAPEDVAPPFGIRAAEFLRAIPNNHLAYAITWWSLAATNLIVAGFFLASRRKKAGPSR